MSDLRRNIAELIKTGNYDMNVKFTLRRLDESTNPIKYFASDSYYKAIINYNKGAKLNNQLQILSSTNNIITKFNNIIQSGI